MKAWALLAGFAALAAAADKTTDVEFARPGGYSLTMDISIPEGLGPHPAVILVHGGGWQNGDKETYIQPWFPVLTRAGFAWFSINYRLAPQFQYPAPVEDIEAAVKFVKSNANKYRVDEGKIALMGESAGGHLVALVAARGKVKVKGVVDFYGPHDLSKLIEANQAAAKALGPLLGFTDMNDAAKKSLAEASPITLVTKRMPPFLFIHGDKDPMVPLSQSTEMCAKMKAAGAKCEVVVVAGANHGVSNWEKNDAWQGYKETMVHWLQETLK